MWPAAFNKYFERLDDGYFALKIDGTKYVHSYQWPFALMYLTTRISHDEYLALYKNVINISNDVIIHNDEISELFNIIIRIKYIHNYNFNNTVIIDFDVFISTTSFAVYKYKIISNIVLRSLSPRTFVKYIKFVKDSPPDWIYCLKNLPPSISHNFKIIVSIAYDMQLIWGVQYAQKVELFLGNESLDLRAIYPCVQHNHDRMNEQEYFVQYLKKWCWLLALAFKRSHNFILPLQIYQAIAQHI